MIKLRVKDFFGSEENTANIVPCQLPSCATGQLVNNVYNSRVWPNDKISSQDVSYQTCSVSSGAPEQFHSNSITAKGCMTSLSASEQHVSGNSQKQAISIHYD